VDVTIAAPGGRVPVPDEAGLAPASNGDNATKIADLRGYLDKVEELLAAPARLEDIDPADFEGVLIPGGHGPMQDLAVDLDVARILGRGGGRGHLGDAPRLTLRHFRSRLSF
jgi:putative intracellular protease/amidase